MLTSGRGCAGMALLFYSLKPTGESDTASMHTGCPVIEGVKWTATKWIHTGPFHEEWLYTPESSDQKRDPELCLDYDEGCSGYAPPRIYGMCRPSCLRPTDEGQHEILWIKSAHLNRLQILHRIVKTTCQLQPLDNREAPLEYMACVNHEVLVRSRFWYLALHLHGRFNTGPTIHMDCSWLV